MGGHQRFAGADCHASRAAEAAGCPSGPHTTRRVGDQQDGGRTGAPDQPKRALAERRRVDEQVAARAVEDDVLALVLERLIQLEDPRAKLVNVHQARPS